MSYFGLITQRHTGTYVLSAVSIQFRFCWGLRVLMRILIRIHILIHEKRRIPDQISGKLVAAPPKC
jgi:hypothetical protein